MNSSFPFAARAHLQLLVQELGGEAGLRAVLARFYERLAQDVMVGFFFNGHDLERIQRHQGDLILKAAGLRESYQGLAPAHAHQKMAPILPGHFDRRIQILREVLAEWGLSSAAQTAWVNFELAFRHVIVSEKK